MHLYVGLKKKIRVREIYLDEWKRANKQVFNVKKKIPTMWIHWFYLFSLSGLQHFPIDTCQSPADWITSPLFKTIVLRMRIITSDSSVHSPISHFRLCTSGTIFLWISSRLLYTSLYLWNSKLVVYFCSMLVRINKIDNSSVFVLLFLHVWNVLNQFLHTVF